MGEPGDGPEGPQSMGMLYPMLPVTSRGGPFDDEAYVCGYEVGFLDGMLHAGVHPLGVAVIKAANREQFDLIAMAHGYVVVDVAWSDTFAPQDTEGWVQIELRRATEWTGELGG